MSKFSSGLDLGKEEIAEQVKRSRKEKGLTQAALGEKTGLSLRSIQRIENGEVNPRAYSIKKLEEALETSFKQKNKELQPGRSSNLASKLVFSIASLVLIPLGALAFLTQSARFPETTFELQVFWFIVLLALSLIQIFIWRNPGTN
ncbi:XRE family transcriptional regulator [Gramella sp. BOM4]|nr:XRE family transcriptional regulator [Christiangramia bathymodioli]